jgi:hypothetical protein
VPTPVIEANAEAASLAAAPLSAIVFMLAGYAFNYS